MDFFVSWSHSDALFSDYFEHCPTLISALPDNRGILRRFNRIPKKIIVDCGSVYYVKQKKRPKLVEVFDIQLSLLQDCTSDVDVSLVHFDEPMLNKTTLSEKYEAMERTLFNAYEYLQVFRSMNFRPSVSSMGVIQGYDRSSIKYSASELIKMGYKKFGIGSLLGKGQSKQIEFIQHAADTVGPDNLHVFGVTGIPQMSAMIEMGIKSMDSSRPTMAAAFFQVFYSDPFRTYYLSDSRANPGAINRISEPLPCDCPVCLTRAKEILIPTPRDYMKLRSIHNYYHLVKTLETMKVAKGRASFAISDVLWAGN